MTDGMIFYDADQNRREQDISHPAVEDIQPVVRLRNQCGFMFACVVSFRILQKQKTHSRSN